MGFQKLKKSISHEPTEEEIKIICFENQKWLLAAVIQLWVATATNLLRQ